MGNFMLPAHFTVIFQSMNIACAHLLIPISIERAQTHLMCTEDQINVLQHIFHRLSQQILSGITEWKLKLKSVIYIQVDIYRQPESNIFNHKKQANSKENNQNHIHNTVKEIENKSVRKSELIVYGAEESVVFWIIFLSTFFCFSS